MKEELEFLKKHLSPNQNVVVACSGGPDSMCLMSLLLELKKELNLKIICAHVNHKLRSISDNEALMVKNFSKKNNITFELKELKKYELEEFSENDAHFERYKFFNEIMEKYDSTTLMTAHHGDDLIETILMRLNRGSNLKGYIGIRKVSYYKGKNGKLKKILRPLLSKSKKDILEYLKEKNIPFCVDESNSSPKYTRNRYRMQVLPFLKSENPNVHKKYLKFSEELLEYEQFIIEYINSRKIIVDNKIDTNKLLTECKLIQKKSIELLIKEAQKMDILEISDNTMEEILKIVNRPNTSIDLKNGYKIINSYGLLMVKKSSRNQYEELIFNHDIEYGNYFFSYQPQQDDLSNCIYLNSEEITLPLKIRSWKEGDRMVVKNLNGSKKISDIFINEKIPKINRNEIPILIDSKDNILWLPNVKKSQFCKDKSEKYDIIIKCEAR